MRAVPPVFRALSALSPIALTLLAAPSAAQVETMHRPGTTEATIYRDTGFRGPAMAVSRAEANLRLAWPVTSIRVKGGTWQLCNGANFRGTCITVTRDDANITGRLGRGSVLQSIRPIGGPGGGGGGAIGGKSLRGMAAEFHPAPTRGGQRVAACRQGSASANCAAQSADAFCKAAGWTGSARQSMETVGRVVYLADVLCTRTGY